MKLDAKRIAVWVAVAVVTGGVAIFWANGYRHQNAHPWQRPSISFCKAHPANEQCILSDEGEE